MIRTICEKMKRKVAALLVVIMAVQTLSPAAAFGAPMLPDAPVEGEILGSAHTPSTLHTSSVSVDDLYEDENGEIILSGKIVYMTDRGGRIKDTRLQLYVNGEPDTAHKVEFGRAEDDLQPMDYDDTVELMNDLDGELVEPVAEASPSNADFDVWEFRYSGLPARDAAGNPYTYEIRDAAYEVATASQALYYTDAEGTEILGEGEDLSRAFQVRMVYVDRADVGGSYVADGKAQADEKAGDAGDAVLTLELSAAREADEEFITEDNEVELDTEDGSWFVSDMLKYNPLTGAPIAWRMAAVGTEADDTYEITYANKGVYQGETDYAYDGGTVYRTQKGGKTFRAVGTIEWEDGGDWGGVRPQELDFIKVLDEAGNDVTGLMDIALESTGADAWEYRIDGLSASQKYTLEQSLQAYTCDGLESVTVSNGFFNWDGVTKLPALKETLKTRSVRGMIDWNGYNPAAKGRDDLDFLRVYAGGRDVTEHVELALSKEYAGQSIWGYTVSGLVNGVDYAIRAEEVEGYVISPAEVAAPAVEVRELWRGSVGGGVETFQAVPRVLVDLTIENQYLGESDQKEDFIYTLKVGEKGRLEDYNGKYTVNGASKTAADGLLIIPAGESAVISQSGGTYYSVTQKISADGTDATVLYDAGTVNAGIETELKKSTAHTFINILKQTINVQKWWNDNGNQNGTGNRPLRATFADSLELKVQRGGVEISSDELAKLGISGAKAVVEEDQEQGANYWSIHYDHLPRTDQHGVKLSYSVMEKLVSGYQTSYTEASKPDVYQELIVNTSYTTFTATKKWMDHENTYLTRPEDLQLGNPDSYSSKLRLWRRTGDGAITEEITGALQDTDKEKECYLEVTPGSADAEPWNIAVSNLVQYDANGKPYTYYMREVLLETTETGAEIDGWKTAYKNDAEDQVSYQASYKNVENYFNESDKCYHRGVITNRLQGETGFALRKVWLDGQITDEEAPDVAFQLMRYPDILDEETGYKQAAPVLATEIYTEKIDGYKTEVDNLPRFDLDGNEYVYYAQETLSGGCAGLSGAYRQIVNNTPHENPAEDDPTTGGKTTMERLHLVLNGGRITNQLYGVQTIPVTKTWKSAAYQKIDARVVLKVERKHADSTDPWEDITNQLDLGMRTIDGFSAEVLTKSTALSGLMKYDTEGYLYEYQISEESVSLKPEKAGADYIALVLDDSGTEPIYKTPKEFDNRQYQYTSVEDKETHTITNRLTGTMDVRVEKIWSEWNESNEHAKPEELTFTLYQNGTVFRGEALQNPKTMKAPWEPVTFENLPRYDERGQEYDYTVKETYDDIGGKKLGWTTYAYDWELGAWSSESERADDVKVARVTNTPPGTGAHIVVQKEWKDGGDIPHREDVTVALYKKDDESWKPTGTTTTLTGSNNWLGYLPVSLEPGQELEDVIEDYRVRETKIGNVEVAYPEGEEKGTVAVTHHHYEVENRRQGDGSWLIINTRKGNVDVAITKTWMDGTKEGTDVTNRPKNATFELFQNGVLKGTKTTKTNQSDETVVWEKLEKYDGEGWLYNYAVTETKMGDTEITNGQVAFDPDHSGNPHIYVSNVSEGTYHHAGKTVNDVLLDTDLIQYTAVNQRKDTVNFKVHKVWKDDDWTNEAVRPDIYFILYRQIGDGPVAEMEDYIGREKVGANPGNDGEFHHIYEFDPVPRYDAQGEEITYYAKEGMHVVNSEYVPLYYRETPEPDGKFELRDKKPLADTLAPNHGTVVNIRREEVFVNGEKIWNPTGGILLNPEDCPSVTLGLMKKKLHDGKPDEPKFYEEMLDSEGNLYQTRLSSTNYNYEFKPEAGEGFPKYEEETGEELSYYVHEVDAPKNYERTSDNRSFVITNTYQDSGACKITLTKFWKNVPDGKKGADARVSLWQVMQKPKADGSDAFEDLEYTKRKREEKTIPYPEKADVEAGNVSAVVTFDNLPQYAPNGRQYRYYIEEETVNGYQITMSPEKETGIRFESNQGTERITLTNTYVPEMNAVSEIKGKKVWDDRKNLHGIRPVDAKDIGLELWRTYKGIEDAHGEKVDAVKVDWNLDTDASNTEAWSYKFESTDNSIVDKTGTPCFPKYAPNGNEYSYWVKEIMTGNLGLCYESSGESGKLTTTQMSGEGGKVLSVTNTPKWTQLKVVKNWEGDSNNIYGTRPETITLAIWRCKKNEVSQTDKWSGWSKYDKVTAELSGDTWETTVKLPLYDAAGEEYVYAAREEDVPKGYTHHEASDHVWELESQTTTLTNHLIPKDVGDEKVLKAEKIWDDENDQDGFRKQTEVTFVLMRKKKGGEDGFGEKVISQVIQAREKEKSSLDGSVILGDWSVEWKNLPKNLPGTEDEAEYFIKEELGKPGADYYTPGESVQDPADGTKWTITNTHAPIENVQIIVTKNWKDETDNKWGLQPASITMQLYKTVGGKTEPVMDEENKHAAQTLSSSSNWTAAFTGLPYAEGGQRIYYSVKEQDPSGAYTASYPDQGVSPAPNPTAGAEHKAAITVTNTLKTASLIVTKAWENGNAGNPLPNAVKLQLERQTSDGSWESVADTEKIVTASNGWKSTFDKLAMCDADGILYQYRATEIGIQMTEDGGWSSVVAAEDSKDEVKRIAGYTVTEGFPQISEDGKTHSQCITNTLEMVDLAVEKVWEDGDNQDGIRSSEITVTLWKGKGNTTGQVEKSYPLELSNDSQWKGGWTELPKYQRDGMTPCVYTLEETGVPEGYQVTYPTSIIVTDSVQKDSKPADAGITYNQVVNTYVPRVMTVTAHKIWRNDGNNPDGSRPEQVTFRLMQQAGTEEEPTPVIGAAAGISTPGNAEDGTWTSAEWKDLPVRKGGEPIFYSVTEDSVKGYGTAISDPVSGDIAVAGNEGNNRKTITVTNTLMATTSASVKKVWLDAGNSLKDEIKSVTFQLQRQYNLALGGEKNSWKDVTDVTDDGKVTIARGGQMQIISDLPRYNTIEEDENRGREYRYRFVEVSMKTQIGDGAETSVTANPTNADGTEGTIGDYAYEIVVSVPGTDGETTTTATNTWTPRAVYAKKVWADSKNQDGKRPDSVTFELLADGNSFNPAKCVVLDGTKDASEAAPWLAEWTGLPKAHADGTPIKYTVSENVTLPNDYTSTYNFAESLGAASNLPYTVSNTYTPATVDFAVDKLWEGDEEWWNDERPDSIEVALYKKVGNNKAELATGSNITNPVKLTSNSTTPWSYTWNDLPKYENPEGTDTEEGEAFEIQYVAIEVSKLEGYAPTASGSNIVNTLRTTEFTIEKTWDDQNNYYGRRPESITVQLERRIGEGPWVPVGMKRELEMKSENAWAAITFTGLPICDKENYFYQYRAIEVKMGITELMNRKALGYQASYDYDTTPGKTTITNTLETTALTGSKAWNDQDNRYGTRPDDISLTLHATPCNALGGIQPQAQPEWNKSGNVWTWTWEDLPKYAVDGSEVEYTVSENVPAHYEVEYSPDHKSMTNTLKLTSLTGTKTWNDQDNRYGLRPGDLELTVYADGEVMPVQPDVQWTKPEGGSQWTYEIPDLPELTASGTPIQYSVKETEVAGYTGAQTGNDLTNILNTGALEVTKLQEGGSATEFAFKVMLEIDGQSMLYNGDYLVSGADEDISQSGTDKTTADGQIVITGGQKFRIDNLPADASYTVTEADKPGYTLKEKQGDQGTIAKDGTAAATFVNRKKSSGGNGGGGGGRPPKDPNNSPYPPNPGPGVPKDPVPPTDQVPPTDPMRPPGVTVNWNMPFDPENPVIDVPGNPPRVEIHDPYGDPIYEGPGTQINIEDWEPGTYTVYTFDSQNVPLGTATITINDEGVPVAYALPKTGDSSMPYALLAAIMLGALGGMTTLVYRRKKNRKDAE